MSQINATGRATMNNNDFVAQSSSIAGRIVQCQFTLWHMHILSGIYLCIETDVE